MKAFIKKHKPVVVLSNFENFNVIRSGMQKLAEDATKTDRGEDAFYDMFTVILQQAVVGDVAAQDYLGYIFKKGMGDLVPENQVLSMKWSIVAASNGNESAIDKLRMFLAQSYDAVLDMENAPNILAGNGIYEENYEIKLGKLFCDAIVDELKINVQTLAKEKAVYLPTNVLSTQIFENARANSLGKVIEYLKR